MPDSARSILRPPEKMNHQSIGLIPSATRGGGTMGFIAKGWIISLAVGSIASANPGRLDAGFIPTPPPNGPVRAIQTLADGSVIVGGEFTSLGSTPQAYLAKYREDGTVDLTFDPVLDGPVQTIAATPQGRFYIGGSFATVDGAPSRGLALITSSGSLTTSPFSVGAGFNGTVLTIKTTIYSSPSLVVGGSFTTYRGASARNLAGLSSSGTLVRNYDVNGPVNAVVDYGSALLFGGSFTSTGAYPAQNVGVADANGAQSNFIVPPPNGPVTDIFAFTAATRAQAVPSSTPAVVFSGAFSTMNGAAPGNAAFRIPSGNFSRMALDAPGITQASCFATDSDRRLLTGHSSGDFWRFAPISEGTWTWSASPDFLPSAHADGKIDAIVQETKFRYYIGGEFTDVDSRAIPFFARLLGPLGANPPSPPIIRKVTAADDRVVVQWNAVEYATGYDLEISGDGGTTWNPGAEATTAFAVAKGLRQGESYRVRVRSKNTNGAGAFGSPALFTTTPGRAAGTPVYTSLPGNWANGNSYVEDLFTDAAGRLVIVGPNDMQGQFFGGFAILDQNLRPAFKYNTTNNPRINHAEADPRGGFIVKPDLKPLQRLNAAGVIELAFAPAYNPSNLWDIAVQSNGHVILGGTMREANGAPNDGLVRLHPDGALDPGFDPLFRKGSSPGSVYRVKALAEDRLLVIGDFTSIDEIAINDLAILDSNGELDPDFRPSPTTTDFWIFNDAAEDPLGRIVAVGLFNNKNGGPRTGVVRLLANGSFDPDWDPPVVTFDGSADDPELVVIQADGKPLIAGMFDGVNGTVTCSVARLQVGGTLDNTFDAGLGLRSSDGERSVLKAMALMPDSTVAVGGWFASADGEEREGFALLRGNSTPGNYQLWLAACGLPAGSDMDHDGDGDGLGLGFEFAYQLDPFAPDAVTFLSVKGQRFQITPPARRGALPVGLFSDDLQSWMTVPIRPDWSLVPPMGSDPMRGFFRIQLDPF